MMYIYIAIPICVLQRQFVAIILLFVLRLQLADLSFGSIVITFIACQLIR